MATATLNKIGKSLEMQDSQDEDVVEELRRSINGLIDDLNAIIVALDARITALEP